MKIKSIIYFLLLLLATASISCKNNFSKLYSYDEKSQVYYHLISFQSTEFPNNQNKLYRVNLCFKNQNDSVFWDSYNNYKNSFVIKIDSNSKSNLLSKALYRFASNDSGAILVRANQFFQQQFKSTELPFFSKNDSVVKINFKIKEEMSEEEFLDLKQELAQKEEEEIFSFLQANQLFDSAFDTTGIYWIEKPVIDSFPSVRGGQSVSISYEGSFLSGKFLEKSPAKFDFVYGTPDQILKGLNYVIPKIKKGQNAKIILPSQLAFGENGSANGLVPPFTPLVYKVKIINIKNK